MIYEVGIDWVMHMGRHLCKQCFLTRFMRMNLVSRPFTISSNKALLKSWENLSCKNEIWIFLLFLSDSLLVWIHRRNVAIQVISILKIIGITGFKYVPWITKLPVRKILVLYEDSIWKLNLNLVSVIFKIIKKMNSWFL